MRIARALRKVIYSSNISNSTVVYDGRIYVFGGSSSLEMHLDTAEVYDPERDRWSMIKCVAQRTCNAQSCLVQWQHDTCALARCGVHRRRQDLHRWWQGGAWGACALRISREMRNVLVFSSSRRLMCSTLRSANIVQTQECCRTRLPVG